MDSFIHLKYGSLVDTHLVLMNLQCELSQFSKFVFLDISDIHSAAPSNSFIESQHFSGFEIV